MFRHSDNVSLELFDEPSNISLEPSLHEQHTVVVLPANHKGIHYIQFTSPLTEDYHSYYIEVIKLCMFIIILFAHRLS